MGNLINKKGLRIDGRKLDEMRPVTISVGNVKNADGSSYIEFGKNKIISAVYGPKEPVFKLPGSSVRDRMYEILENLFREKKICCFRPFIYTRSIIKSCIFIII